MNQEQRLQYLKKYLLKFLVTVCDCGSKMLTVIDQMRRHLNILTYL